MGKVIMSGVSKGMTAPMMFDPVLNNNTWEQIRAASDAGIASTLWSVGDCKEIVLNGTVGDLTLSKYTTYAYIIGFDHNAEVEGGNRIHFQLAKTTLSSGADIAFCGEYKTWASETGHFSMNTSNTNSGGWASSQMRTNICGTSLDAYSGTLIGVVPDTLRAVLKPVTKYTDNAGNSTSASTVTETTDYFFILSEYEVFGTISRSNTNESTKQRQYDYYSSGNSVIKYIYNDTNTVAICWLRSPTASSSNSFASISTDGTATGQYSTYTIGISPAFCV